MRTMRDTLLRPRRFWLLVALLALLPLDAEAAQPPQDNDSLFVGRRIPVREIRRKPKRRRRIGRKRPAVERVPYLALQLKLYKLREDGSAVETNSQAKFHPDDRLRLGVRANQRGYLTIIHQPEVGGDGQILFPTSRLNDGGNYVEANREFVVPSNCPAGVKPFDCAYTVREGTGRELFTIIFSRDAILDLPESGTTAEGRIQAQVLSELEKESVKPRSERAVTPSSPYAVVVVNENPQDNEEIVKRFGILVEGAGAAPVTGTLDDGSGDQSPSASPSNTSSPPPPVTSPGETGGSTAKNYPVQGGRDVTSIALIVMAALGVAGVAAAIIYILAAGRGLGR